MHNDKSDACGPENQGIDGPIGPEINKDEKYKLTQQFIYGFGFNIHDGDIIWWFIDGLATISMKYSL